MRINTAFRSALLSEITTEFLLHYFVLLSKRIQFG